MSFLGGYLLKSSKFMHVSYLYPVRCGLTVNLWLGSLRPQKNIRGAFESSWPESHLKIWRNGISCRSLLCGSENFSTYFRTLFYLESTVPVIQLLFFPVRFYSNSQGDNCTDLCIMCTYYIGAWPSKTCILNISSVENNKPNVQSENAIKWFFFLKARQS